MGGWLSRMSEAAPKTIGIYELDKALDATYEITRMPGDLGDVWLIHARYAGAPGVPDVVHTVRHQPIQPLAEGRFIGPVNHADLVRSLLLDGYNYARIKSKRTPGAWNELISAVIEEELYKSWQKQMVPVDGVPTEFNSIEIEGCQFLAARLGAVSVGLSSQAELSRRTRLVTTYLALDG